jgi:hypothetical protein
MTVLLAIASQVAALAPIPFPRKDTTKDADALLEEAYPKKVQEIKEFPHRFVIRIPPDKPPCVGQHGLELNGVGGIAGAELAKTRRALARYRRRRGYKNKRSTAA